MNIEICRLFVRCFLEANPTQIKTIRYVVFCFVLFCLVLGISCFLVLEANLKETRNLLSRRVVPPRRSRHPTSHLREDEALLAGEDETAPLGDFVEHPGGFLQPGEVQRVHHFLALHERELVEVIVSRDAVLYGIKVFPGALDVPLLEVPVVVRGRFVGGGGVPSYAQASALLGTLKTLLEVYVLKKGVGGGRSDHVVHRHAGLKRLVENC